MPRRLLPPLAAALVAAIGLAGLVYGIMLATTLSPPTHTVGRLSGASAPVVDTATGVLELDGPRVVVRATSPSGGPVFIGIARADDVTAYLGAVTRVDITRADGDGTLGLARSGTEPNLPDPAGADVWAVSVAGTGSAALTWPDTPGQWRVVVASDGTAVAPSQITLDWTRAERSTPAPVVIAVGVLLLVGGLVGMLVLRGRARDEDDEDENDDENDDDENEADDEADGARRDVDDRGHRDRYDADRYDADRHDRDRHDRDPDHGVRDGDEDGSSTGSVPGELGRRSDETTRLLRLRRDEGEGWR